MNDSKTNYVKQFFEKYIQYTNRKLRFKSHELDNLGSEFYSKFHTEDSCELATAEDVNYFDKKLEAIIEAEENYTVSHVLKHPVKYSAGGFSEAMRDISELGNLISGSNFRKNLLLNLGIFTSFALTSVPHELMHAGANTLLGNENKEIVINTLYGGDLWYEIIPSIQSKWLFPLIGGYVDPGKLPPLEHIVVGLTPYAMTSAGIYVLKKGIEKKSKPLGYLGAGIVAAHCGGVISDFYNLGRVMTNSAYEFITNTFNMDQDSTVENLLVWGGGFYLGTKILSLTYTFSKGLVNSIKRYFKPISSMHPRISGA